MVDRRGAVVGGVVAPLTYSMFSRHPRGASRRLWTSQFRAPSDLDLILYGLPEVMPVERELLATDFQVTLGSSSAILAHNFAVLGAQVGFLTLVGEDALGKIALERLGAEAALT